MAEALGVISSVAAVAQLTGGFVKLTTDLRHYIKALRSAPEEVQAFMMETMSFTGLLNFFTELAGRPMLNQRKGEQREREKRVSKIERQCAYVRDKMEDFVDRFSALANENLTPFESIIERIRYLLDKPDIKDLRLSIHMAATMVNAMSTLFMWESGGHNDVLLEQLKNLLPVAKQASTDLAKHQQRHGLSHEPGMHDNVMLEISKEIQRQIAHAIKPHLRPGTTEGRFPGPRRRERRRDSSIIDEADFRRRWASPSRRSGSDADSVGDGPRRTAKNRVSFQTATNATEHDAEIGHNGIVAQTVDSHEPQSPDVQIPSPPADDTGHTVEPESDEAWFGRARRIRANELVQEDRNSQEHSQRSQSPGNHWALDISDPTKPRIHQCRGPCVDEHCSSCGQTHCIRDHCRSDEQTAPKEGKKILDDNVPRELSPLPEPEKPITSTGSSHKEAIPPQEARVKHSPSLTAESEEQSGKSDKGVSSLKNGSSRTSLAPPSSKSSNPSVGRPRSPDAKERHSTGLRVVTNEVQEMPDPSNGVPDVPKTESQPQSQPQPQPQPEPEQKPEQDNHAPVQEGPRRLEGLEIWNKQAEQRRRRRSRPVSYQSHVSDGSDAGSGKPSPYVPVPPFGGQGSRRRPRRPRSTVSEEPEQGAV